MDIKNMAGLIVGVVVGVVLLSALLFPVIGEATATTSTFKNEGYFQLDKFTDEYTLEWDAADPDTITINGEDITYHNNSGMAVSVVLGENFALRLNADNARMSFYNAGTFVNTSETYPTMTVTFASGSVVATNGNTSKTVSSVSELYGLVDAGDYVMKKTDAVAYLNSGSEIVADSEIYATGQTYSGSNNILWHLEGTIDDMKYPDEFNSSYTVTNQTINGAYSTKYNDLYELNNLQFTVTTSGSIVYNVTASFFVVPAEVTAEKTVHMTDVENTIVSIIPILTVVGLILGVLAFFYSRRE